MCFLADGYVPVGDGRPRPGAQASLWNQPPYSSTKAIS